MCGHQVRVVLSIEPFLVRSAVQACLAQNALLDVVVDQSAGSNEECSWHHPAIPVVDVKLSEEPLQFELTYQQQQQFVEYRSLDHLAERLEAYAGFPAA